MDEQEEAYLVGCVGDGDRRAFARLVAEHQRPLSAYARRMLSDTAAADDVVQETLLRLWTKAHRFNPKAARLTTWLHRIAHNLCVDTLRRDARWQTTEALEELRTDQGPGASVLQRDRARQVQVALGGLPERQRSALLLCHYQGLSNMDAARVLDVSVDALESLLARARRSLRKELEAGT